MRIAYFDCFSGVSGDMCLGALIGAGAPADRLVGLPQRLKLDGVRVQIGSARRGPFAATRVEVVVEDAKQPHRHLKHIVAILDAADIDAEVRKQAHAVFMRLARAEAEVHGQTLEKVHFHEVGAADALVDIVGTIESLTALGVERVYSTTLRLGRGSVSSEHGRIPVPAPATTLLLRGVPVEIPEIDFELVTPTGAALLATLVEAWVAPPPFRLDVIGTGAGGRDLKEQANVLRVLIGEVAATPLARGRVTVIETAIDDENPQTLAALVPRLLASGAHDAMMVPVVMKKGRLGTWLVVIAPLEHAEALARLVLEGTSTLGVRMRQEERIELERRAVQVATAFGQVSLKLAMLPGGGERAMPEFESVRAVAEQSGRSWREVADAALAAWGSGSERGT